MIGQAHADVQTGFIRKFQAAFDMQWFFDVDPALLRRLYLEQWPPASSPLGARASLLRFPQPLGDTPASK